MARKKRKKRKKKSPDISGLLGNRIKVRKVGNSIIITNYPEKKMGKQSPAQIAHHEKVKEAAVYANLQYDDKEAYRLYASRITKNKKSVYAVAFADFFNSPEVQDIDASRYRGAIGDIIQITATDDFMVVQVEVSIIRTDGSIIEEGDAVQDGVNPTFWNYTITVANSSFKGATVRVVAYDRPGNRGEGQVVV